MSAYCERNDLFRFGGLPAGSFPNPGRVIAAVDATTEILTLDQHGFDDDDALVFRAEGGGSLPAPLVAGTTYYAKRLTDATFPVAAAAGGAAIGLTTAGSRIVVVKELPFDELIELASSELDNILVGHPVPLEAPYEPVIVGWVATRTAQLMCLHTGQVQHGERIAEQLKAAGGRLEAWRRGVPVRGGSAPASSASLAVSSATSGTDPRGWVPTGGTLP